MRKIGIGLTGTVGTYNAFAYCENGPVSCMDYFGFAKTYTTISKKNKSFSYIINSAIRLYKNSKIYKMSYIISNIFVDRRIKKVKIPTFVHNRTYMYDSKIYKLKYISGHHTTRNQMYYVTFGCMTVDEWKTYIIGKHVVDLLDYKETIEDKFGLNDEIVSIILELASEAARLITLALSYGNYVLADSVKNVFSKMDEYSEYLDMFLEFCKNYRDKEDRYISSI